MLISTTHRRPESVFVRETYHVTSSLTILAFWLSDKNLLNPPTWTYRIGVPGRLSWRLSLGHNVYRVGTWANHRVGTNPVGAIRVNSTRLSVSEALAHGWSWKMASEARHVIE